MNSPHKGPVTRKMLPFDDVTMLKGMHTRFARCRVYHNFMLVDCVDIFRGNCADAGAVTSLTNIYDTTTIKQNAQKGLHVFWDIMHMKKSTCHEPII